MLLVNTMFNRKLIVAHYYILVIALILIFVRTFQLSPQVYAQGKPNVVPDKFIVVLNDTVTDPQSVASDIAHANDLLVDHIYSSALKGFSATIPTARLTKIKKDSRVQFVSEDRTVNTFAQSTPIGINRIKSPFNPNK